MDSRLRFALWLGSVVGLLFCVDPARVGAQNPDAALAALRLLGLDSIRAGRVSTYFRPAHSARANLIHRLHLALSAFGEDSLRVTPVTRVAVLDSVDWAKLTPLPYGFPNNFGPPVNLILCAAVTSPPAGAETVLTSEARDAVYMSHEGGHVLSWALMPGDMLDSIRGTCTPFASWITYLSFDDGHPGKKAAPRSI